MERSEAKTKDWSNLIFFLSKFPSLSIYYWSFLLVYIWITPNEGPKSFVN